MPCVIVVGLPRSGTSATAGVIHKLGVDMGDDLMPPSPLYNPKGFYEDLDFTRIHDALLMGRHRDPDITAKTDDPELWKSYTEMIRSRCWNKTLWGVKDPKTCFLLPQFLDRLPTFYPATIVLVNRPFDKVVRSYSKLWGGMTLDQALLRVSRYQYAMFMNIEEVRTHKNVYKIHTVDYDEMTEQPRASIKKLAQALNLPFTESAVQFFDSRLNHSHPPRSEKP